MSSNLLGFDPFDFSHPSPPANDRELDLHTNGNWKKEERPPSPAPLLMLELDELSMEHEDDADNDWRFQIEVQEPLSGNRDQEDEFDDPLDRPLSPLHLDLLHIGTPDIARPLSRFAKPTPKTRPPLDYGYNFPERPNGKKRRALLIGIRGKHLLGCHNDVEDMKDLLLKVCKFQEQEIMILKDEDANSRKWPSRDVVLDHLEILVKDAKPGDRLFLHFSGHGGQIPDLDGDEADMLDEVICCADDQVIVDDDLHDIIVKAIPKGCQLTAVFDCCASGTGLDIVRTPYLSPAATPDRSNGVLDLPNTYESKRQSGSPNSSKLSMSPGSGWAGGRKKRSDGDVIMWSACLDSGNSHEVVTEGGKHKGAMTQAFVRCLKLMPDQSYSHLLEAITKTFEIWKVPQTPQLSTAQRIDQREIFRICEDM